MTIIMTSDAFDSGQAIPKQYTGDGGNVSPPLSWSSLPEGVKELALIADDPDAPGREPWVHWVIYKIPTDAPGLSKGIPASPNPSTPDGALQGRNSWGSIGYGGPAPPKGHGVHHYHFKLYALDTALTVEPGLDKSGLLKAMSAHIIAQGVLVGTYQR